MLPEAEKVLSAKYKVGVATKPIYLTFAPAAFIPCNRALQSSRELRRPSRPTQIRFDSASCCANKTIFAKQNQSYMLAQERGHYCYL